MLVVGSPQIVRTVRLGLSDGGGPRGGPFLNPLRCEQRMNPLQSSFYTAAIISCLLCAFVVGSKRAPRRFNFLVAYLVLESLRFLFQWLLVQPAAPAKALWLGLLMISSFLLAPLLWLFAREIAEQRSPSIRSLRGWHLGVMVTGVLLTLPLLLKTHLGTDFVDPDNITPPLHSLFIHSTMLAAIFLFLCQVPVYLTACARLLGNHSHLIKAMFSDLEPGSAGTLRLLIFIVSTNWLVGLLRALNSLALGGAGAGLGIVFCALEVGVTAAVVFVLMRRSTVFSIEDRELAQEMLDSGAAAADGAAVKYARSALDLPARSRIRRKLHDAMTAGRLHRDCRVSLRSLCESLKENPHYVSQVINQDLGTNFYDLIKKHRVEDAMTALVAEPDKSVLDIALEVGFNSKSTFNAAFRQHAGMTPREFRAARKLGQATPEPADSPPV
jgi:AraC-like DNA-binding protein